MLASLIDLFLNADVWNEKKINSLTPIITNQVINFLIEKGIHWEAGIYVLLSLIELLKQNPSLNSLRTCTINEKELCTWVRSGSSSWASLRNLKLACTSEMIDNLGRQKIFSSLEDEKFCDDVFRPCECEYFLCLDMYVEINMNVRVHVCKGRE